MCILKNIINPISKNDTNNYFIKSISQSMLLYLCNYIIVDEETGRVCLEPIKCRIVFRSLKSSSVIPKSPIVCQALLLTGAFTVLTESTKEKGREQEGVRKRTFPCCCLYAVCDSDSYTVTTLSCFRYVCLAIFPFTPIRRDIVPWQ